MNRLQGRFELAFSGFSLRAELDVDAQGVIALFGRSGTGKTTLLRCLAGLERCPSGELRYGEQVWQDEKRGVFVPVQQRDIGFVFQEPRLLPHLRVKQNLAYGWSRTPADKRRCTWEAVIESLGVGAWLESYPHQLSSGQQQRVALARALLSSPSLLLMDEPLAALDQQSRRELMPYLQQLHRLFSGAVVYVSHAVEEVLQLADSMVLLDEGRVVCADSAARVFARVDVAAYLGTMLGAVLEGHVAEHIPADGLSRIACCGRDIWAPLTKHATGSRVRLHIPAHEVAISLAPLGAQHSVQNVLPAVVTKIHLGEQDGASAIVELDIGCPLLARISRRSLRELALETGKPVYAYFKALSLQPRAID
ncbi:MAG: molybdenum ABC transporter ATP-binding protein [Pseudomonadota bacterium]